MPNEINEPPSNIPCSVVFSKISPVFCSIRQMFAPFFPFFLCALLHLRSPSPSPDLDRLLEYFQA